MLPDRPASPNAFLPVACLLPAPYGASCNIGSGTPDCSRSPFDATSGLIMPTHSTRDLIGTMDRLRSALEPASALSRAINSDPGFYSLLAAANRSHEVLRPMLGPIEDLRNSGLLDATGRLASKLEGVSSLAAKLHKHYRLPALGETVAHLQSPQLQALWKTLDRSSEFLAPLQRAADSLTAPWLSTTNASVSFSGFCELQGIGQQLRRSAAFDADAAGRLRLVLGDLRDPVEWPTPIFEDPLARTDFYLDRGLDPALSDFPAEAFDQIIASARLKDAPPPLLSDYSGDTDTDHESEEAGFARTNAAHGRLQRFETHIRRFIERQLRGISGDNWIKERVPPEIRKDWQEKQQRARDSGEPNRRAIAYADFTDYEQIILRKDNWQDVFASVFTRKTLVQESFQRLYPIRVCAMHARIVTQDDELYLYVETKRLLAAIGIAS